MYRRPRLVNWYPQLNNISERIKVHEKDIPIKIHCDYFATIDRDLFIATWRINQIKIYNTTHYFITPQFGEDLLTKQYSVRSTLNNYRL